MARELDVKRRKLVKTNPKILLVSGASLSVYGGRERWIMEVAKLARNFSLTTICTLTDYGEVKSHRLKLIREEMMKLGVAYHEIKTAKVGFGVVKRIPISIHKLAKLLMHHQKVYVAGDLFFGILFSLLALLIGRRGLIIGLHVSPSMKKLRYALPLLRVLGKLHAVETIHVVNIVDFIQLKRSIKVKVVYIPNFVDCTKFRPLSAKRSDVFQALFVGALEFKKGIDVFLKAAEQFKRSVSNVRFIIASYGGSWEKDVLRYAKSGLVEYKGFVTDEELIKLYGESHVLIMPSREEPFGLVALEAQACGTPVISANLPPFRLTVKEGVTGFRVKSYEVDEWIEALRKMYMFWKFDREAYTSMCKEAREHVRKNFYLNIVKSLIKLLLGSEELH
ncbi:MAG: glycosyltransferase family 4 protein [Nitrososphaerota archaeon]